MYTITQWPGSPLLIAVGRTLDEGLECVAYEHGFVWPTTKHVPKHLAGMLEGVIADGAQQGQGAQAGPGGPAAGPRQGAAAGGSAQGAASGDSGAPLVGRVSEVTGLAEALERYPQFALGGASEGVVKLFGVIQPIADLPIAASLVVYIPLNSPAATVGWAWWTDGVWVGPRHTYASGNICAFEVTDGTWRPELGVRLLLDLCAAWLARQLYLRAYGRWPGLQRIHSALERQAEQLPGEYCGCGSMRKYERCCASSDRIAVALRDVERRREELMRRGPRLSDAPRPSAPSKAV